MKRLFCVKSGLIFILVVVLAGCATTAQYRKNMQGWVGKDVNQLIDIWGYPDNTIKSPAGNEVYVYRFRQVGKYPKTYIPGTTSVSSNNGNTVMNYTPGYYSGGGSYDLKCTTWFEFNNAKRIIRVTFRGNDCKA